MDHFSKWLKDNRLNLVVVVVGRKKGIKGYVTTDQNAQPFYP